MHTAQLTLTLWFLGSASLPLIMGPLTDRFGRRHTLFFGGIIYVISTIICATTNHIGLFLSARFIEGSMIASMIVAGYSTIHEQYDAKDAVRIVALMASIVIIAPGLGPLAGSIVLYFYESWRLIFWIIAALSITALTGLYYCMPETLPVEKRQPLRLEKLLRHYASMLANKKLVLHLLLFGFIFSGFIIWLSIGPLLMVNQFHYSALVFGVTQSMIFSANIIANQITKRYAETVSLRQFVRYSVYIVTLSSIAFFLIAFFFKTALWLCMLLVACYAFGGGLSFAPLNRIIIDLSDAPMGMRVALFSVCFTGFAALGSGLASLLFQGTLVSFAGIVLAVSMTASTIYLALQR